MDQRAYRGEDQQSKRRSSFPRHPDGVAIVDGIEPLIRHLARPVGSLVVRRVESVLVDESLEFVEGGRPGRHHVGRL